LRCHPRKTFFLDFPSRDFFFVALRLTGGKKINRAWPESPFSWIFSPVKKFSPSRADFSHVLLPFWEMCHAKPEIRDHMREMRFPKMEICRAKTENFFLSVGPPDYK
jgi:hypothetical protein